MVDVFSEQHFRTLLQVTDGRSAVYREHIDLVSLSNDGMSTRGKRSQTVLCCWTSSRALEVCRRI